MTALKLRQGGVPPLTFQLLVYPQVDFLDDSPSMREFANGHFITSDLVAYFSRHYLGTQDRSHHDVSPLNADLRGLPPAFVLTAECDPLRDQGEAYARKLAAAGVPVTQKRYEGMFHPFFSLSGIIDGGKTAIADAAAALRAAPTTFSTRVCPTQPVVPALQAPNPVCVGSGLAPAAEDQAAEGETEPEGADRERADRHGLAPDREALPATERLFFLDRQLLAAALFAQRTASAEAQVEIVEDLRRVALGHAASV